ncbi:MAG: TadE/TadG family type IV pilus assembly protein [Microthrixaceae bacterium]
MTWWGRRVHARRSQRGAVMVEAALVLPVMILIVVGILEFGLLFTTYSTTTASTRSGARLAATSYAQAGTVTSAQTAAAEQIAAATAADLKVLNNGTPVGMAIYRVDAASTDGAPSGGYPSSNMASGCTTNCIKFHWNAATQAFVYSSGSWTNPDACLPAPVDSIGVYVQTEHDYITGFFGQKRKVEGHTVMRLEPLPTDQCG